MFRVCSITVTYYLLGVEAEGFAVYLSQALCSPHVFCHTILPVRVSTIIITGQLTRVIPAETRFKIKSSPKRTKTKQNLNI